MKQVKPVTSYSGGGSSQSSVKNPSNALVNPSVAGAAEQEELLAKERDLKFKIWLQNKSIKEKGFEVGLPLSLIKLLINIFFCSSTFPNWTAAEQPMTRV
jgi:hypothetical protein